MDPIWASTHGYRARKTIIIIIPTVDGPEEFIVEFFGWPPPESDGRPVRRFYPIWKPYQ